MCYEGFSACKRSAESQTLRVHPVASKTLTQKRPVYYAAPERFVGDLSFSIVFFLGMVYGDVPIPKWTKPWSPHTQSLSGETVTRWGGGGGGASGVEFFNYFSY